MNLCKCGVGRAVISFPVCSKSFAKNGLEKKFKWWIDTYARHDFAKKSLGRSKFHLNIASKI